MFSRCKFPSRALFQLMPQKPDFSNVKVLVSPILTWRYNFTTYLFNQDLDLRKYLKAASLLSLQACSVSALTQIKDWWWGRGCHFPPFFFSNLFIRHEELRVFMPRIVLSLGNNKQKNVFLPRRSYHFYKIAFRFFTSFICLLVCVLRDCG